ncbi:protein-glutamine gamma-glutamyltransferase E-like [Rhinatrema bivittatum]|uniref:protein-glutamine gamma-glutamyltransferase E-like n=1 Tax=Rhinatrema bivittatum TaxID=194408 RepID=UPI001127A83D|nr:protein-glutamine gamma-glutamyltransferase E-like [Rhinatrema bivittatum]
MSSNNKLHASASIRKAHRTAAYNSPGLIVRRAQPFVITLEFNRPTQDIQNVVFTVVTGPAPSVTDKTKAIFSASDSGGKKGTWYAVRSSSSPESLRTIIYSPANAIIGIYDLSIQISSGEQTSSHMLGQFTLLFNPWSPADDVYMASEDEREEYVLNDSGIFYMGTLKKSQRLGWNYGQFEKDILDISLDILDRSLEHFNNPVADHAKRGDPVYVGRVISAMINSNDENGVLEGKWEDEFTDGMNPTSFTGSAEILRSWRKGGYQPVKYGQCWIFAGVMCTVLRCLGIPTRVITNYNSAHNTDGILSVDVFYDSNGKILDISDDSVWNFHVWNESWFIRRDLGQFYDGWQVLDSTPQEVSKGIYCCGPTSVNAVKEGEVDLDYDGMFVYSEVNSDRVSWIYHNDKKWEKVFSDITAVGQRISTKALGSNEPVDITNSYKYQEGSAKEREIYNKVSNKLLERSSTRENFMASRNGGSEEKPEAPEDSKDPGIHGKLRLVDPPVFGQDINLMLILTNLTSEMKKVKVNISASSTLYTGRPMRELLKDFRSVFLGPQQEEEIPIDVYFSEYEKYLPMPNMLQVSAMCEVKNGGKLVVRKDVSVENPSIKIKVLGPVIVKKSASAEISFTNPLPKPVDDCIVLVEGGGLIKGRLTGELPYLRPKQSSKFQIDFIPHRAGRRQLLVEIKSKGFTLKGFQSILVNKQRPTFGAQPWQPPQ